MPAIDERGRIRMWRPDSPLVSAMFRVEREDRLKTTYSEDFVVVAFYEGALDGWYRGAVRTHRAGSIKLKEPGEVHRDLRVHAPFTLQGAAFSRETVAAVADALGVRGPVQFKAAGFGAGERATRLAFAMHAALVRPDATELERATRVAETLGELVVDGARSSVTSPTSPKRAPRAVRLARAFLHDALAGKITLDELAAHARLDKFHLVRAFRSEVGLPPYEYLTHLRIWKAKELLQRGARVADAAQAVGFYDESQLHRHFRRIVGLTPGNFSRSFAGARKSQHRPSSARPGAAHSTHDQTQSH